MCAALSYLRRVTVFAAALLLMSAPALETQARTDTARGARGAQPGEQSEGMRQMRAMAPMMRQMMQTMTQEVLVLLAEPETATQMATFTKNYYDALVARGFTKEEALRIVIGHGIPALPATH